MTDAARRSHVLVIEDDRKLAAALTSGIEADGYRVTAASSAEEGFFLLHSEKPDLLLLDFGLPQRNGLDLLRQIRKDRIDVRILMLTSHNTIEERVEGLKAGADDYLGKPFSFPELLARMEALLRRILPEAASDVISVADLSLNTKSRSATRAERPIELSQREFDLLLYLVENEGRTVSREMLAKEIDGTAFRLMGTGVSALREGSEADDSDMLDRRAAHAERAIDGLRKKFGQAAVIRGIAYDGPEKDAQE